MNSKQIKAKRRRFRQKEKKKANEVKLKLNDEMEINLLPTNSLFNKRVQFDQMSLNLNGINLVPVKGIIIKVEFKCSEPLITVLLDDNHSNPIKSKRIEALLGDEGKLVVSTPSELLNFKFIS